MLKKLPTIGLAASIGCALIVFAPITAVASAAQSSHPDEVSAEVTVRAPPAKKVMSPQAAASAAARNAPAASVRPARVPDTSYTHYGDAPAASAPADSSSDASAKPAKAKKVKPVKPGKAMKAMKARAKAQAQAPEASK